MGERRGAYRVLMWKHEEKRPLGRPRRGLRDNIKIEFQKYDVRMWTGFTCLRKGTSGGAMNL